MEDKDKQEQRAEESEYKGNPMITLHPYGNHGFSFGYKKACLIVDLIDDIKAFVDRHKEQ